MKISIIVPCYNAESTIKKCLDSIFDQTYKNIEVILINDASTDNTLSILKEYNKAIIIDNKNNKGIGYSRNVGIKKSTGDYIMFVDSDDYIKPNMVEELLNNSLNNNADLVICDYEKIINKRSYDNEYDFSDTLTTLKESPDMLLNINLSPWNKLYKKKLLKNNFFPEDLKYEDAIFVIRSFNNAKKIKIINKKLYNYIVRNNSETTVVDEKVFDILKVSNLIFKELNNYIENDYLEAFMIRNLFRYTIQQKYQINKKLKYKFVDDVFNFLNDNFPKWKKNKIYNKRNIIKRTIEKNKILTKLYISF